MFKKKVFFPAKKIFGVFFHYTLLPFKTKKGETTIYEPLHIDEAVQKKENKKKENNFNLI